jgi:hypothetical protein
MQAEEKAEAPVSEGFALLGRGEAAPGRPAQASISRVKGTPVSGQRKMFMMR